MATFGREDEAIGHWLGQLRDGSAEEQAEARTELGLILERRGLLDDAVDAYRANVAAGVRDPRPYERLAAIYRARGDTASESSIREARDRALGRADAPAPAGPLGASPARPPADRSAVGEDRRSGSPARGGLIVAVVGVLVLLAALLFAFFRPGSGDGEGTLIGQIGSLGDRSPAGTASSKAGAAGATAAASPTPEPPPASCWDAAVRFPQSRQPAESVRAAKLEYLRRQSSAVDPETPRIKSILDAHAARADDLMAGWMGVQLQWARRGLDGNRLSLASFVGSDVLIPNEVGQYVLRATITPGGWQDMQAWPADTCEGAFMQRAENAPWVARMQASVGSTAWASALPSPPASPSPSPSPASR